MRAREYRVIVMAVEEGVNSGVRRAFKHSEAEPPTPAQVQWIIDSVIDAICEWHTFEDDQ